MSNLLHASIQIPPDVSVAELNGEAVLLQVTTGKYFGLDATGARIWQLLAKHQQLAAILPVMLTEFDVTPEKLTQDVLAFAEKLLAHQLIVITDA